MIYNGAGGLSDLAETVRRVTADLRPHAWTFSSIAVSGVSGLVVGAPVALRLRKPLIVVRKDAEPHHAGPQVIGMKDIGQCYLFLDDFASTGRTRKRVKTAIDTEHEGRALAQADAPADQQPLRPAMVAEYFYSHKHDCAGYHRLLP